ncbi:MAG: DUF3450 family protein [Planctomycetota bacterium]
MKLEHENRRTMGRAVRRAATVLAVLAVGLFLSSVRDGRAAPGGDDEQEEMRAVLERLVETGRVIAKEREDWEIGREVLQERIGVVQRDVDAARERLAETGKTIGETSTEVDKLREDEATLKRQSAEMLARVEKTESRIRALLPRLPDPLRKKLETFVQRIPAPGAETPLSLGERYGISIIIMNEINKFGSLVSREPEVRTLADGSTAQVTTIYLGISRAYYATADGKHAGVGADDGEAWTWRPADDAAPSIAKALKILDGEQLAEFVSLPVAFGAATGENK